MENGPWPGRAGPLATLLLTALRRRRGGGGDADRGDGDMDDNDNEDEDDGDTDDQRGWIPPTTRPLPSTLGGQRGTQRPASTAGSVQAAVAREVCAAEEGLQLSSELPPTAHVGPLWEGRGIMGKL